MRGERPIRRGPKERTGSSSDNRGKTQDSSQTLVIARSRRKTRVFRSIIKEARMTAIGVETHLTSDSDHRGFSDASVVSRVV
jgi:hypothetical protein